MWTSSQSKPAASAMRVDAANSAIIVAMSASVSSRGVWLLASYGTADGATISHASASGSGAPPSTQGSLHAAFRPACPIWIPIFAAECACTKSVMRFHAGTCSGRYSPVQPGVMRPSGDTAVASQITSPAPPTLDSFASRLT